MFLFLDDLSQITLDTEKSISGGQYNSNLKETNNNEINQAKYNSGPRGPKFENQLEGEGVDESRETNNPSNYVAQPIDEQHYSSQPENYENVYASDYNQYNQYDPAQYQQFYDNQQYPENQEYSQDQHYPQDESYLPDQQYLEKENFKDEPYKEQKYDNQPAKKREEKK